MRDPQPTYGDGVTDFDSDDVLVMFARDRAAVVPASLRRLDPDTLESVMQVSRAATHADHALLALDRDVATARATGASWGAIGWVLGMTGEGARKRFGGTL